MPALNPVTFNAPPVNPSPNGLFAATQWTDDAGPLRWLPGGVDVRVFNYGGEDAFGVWTADWNAPESDLGEGDVKDGERPDFPDTFLAITTYGYDECDLTKASQAEIRLRAQQTHRLQEQLAVETAFAVRVAADAPSTETVANITELVAHLEGALAKTNTLGYLHAGAHLAAAAASAQLIVRSGSVLKTPLGHTWVFGGGYIDELEDTVFATSQPFGWRGPVEVRDAPSLKYNEAKAVAERSLVIGYEAVIAAAEIDT